MDSISNMLTSIRNALAVSKESCSVPLSRMTTEISRVLKENKFIEDFKIETQEKSKIGHLRLKLRYIDGCPAVTEIKRVSHLGRRVYVKYHDIKTSRFGIVILSTPKGVMKAADAKKNKFGGEVICSVR
jgi:small subunit ribosomal protein S8